MNKPTKTENGTKNDSIKQKLLDNRLWFLIGAAFIGIALVIFWVKWNGCLPFISFNLKETIGIKEETKGLGVDSSLITLLLVLPTLLFLWIFRTHDIREQIEKAESQINKTQINTLSSILTHALDMITSNDFKRRSMSLIQLAQLKRQTQDFDAQIDLATRGLDLSVDLSEDASLSKYTPLSKVTPAEYKKSPLILSSLENMDLRGANLRGANLSIANLSYAKLGSVELGGANLSCADMTGTLLVEANLKDAIMWNATLNNASLSGADLSGSICTSADLSGANLRGANLSGADLSNANLFGADLSGANLSDARDLSEAQYNDETQFPEGFDPDARDMILIDL